MADLVVLGHGLQAGVEIVAGGGVEIGLGDLAVHLVLQLVQKGAGLGMNGHLEIHQQADVRLLLLGGLGAVLLGLDLLDELSQGLTLDILGDDRPLAVDHGNLQHLGDVQTRLLNSGLVQGLVQDVSLGILCVEDLDATVAVAVDGLVVSDCNDSIQFHIYILLNSYARLPLR